MLRWRTCFEKVDCVLNAKRKTAWHALNQQVIACERCPRLREYCREVAETKRKSFAEWEYWGKPVPNFGDPQAQLLIVGLAPAAHGANRTGRMFTGDRSGDWLYRALHKAGFASQADSRELNDGLKLKNCAITAICHCAPPANKPAREEIDNCLPWLDELLQSGRHRVFLALGQIGWRGIWLKLRAQGWCAGSIPKFGHGRQVEIAANRWLLGSYHPSQQNTFTGRLTEQMLDEIFATVKDLLVA